MILLLVVAEGIMPAYAVDLNSVLNTSGAPAKPKFQFQESVFIDYHRGGKLKEIFEGKNITVNFGADSSNTSIMELANKINTYLLKDAHSLVKVTNLQVYYAASLQGEQQSATIDYKLAIQTSGEIPVIPADELPPRFEQYLIVEVTIDTEGRVADARLLSGMATPKIEQTVLSAIRGFKYIPAKRDGTPIPCQLDIVVHIPS